MRNTNHSPGQWELLTYCKINNEIEHNTPWKHIASCLKAIVFIGTQEKNPGIWTGNLQYTVLVHTLCPMPYWFPNLPEKSSSCRSFSIEDLSRKSSLLCQSHCLWAYWLERHLKHLLHMWWPPRDPPTSWKLCLAQGTRRLRKSQALLCSLLITPARGARG